LRGFDDETGTFVHDGLRPPRHGALRQREGPRYQGDCKPSPPNNV
jgi:hypothetical protein